MTGFLGELFGAVLTVKSAHADAGVLDHLARVNERRRRTGLRDQLVTKLLGGFNLATVDLGVGLVLLLAVPAMRRGDFTVGDLALFVSYIGNLVWLPYYAGRLIAGTVRPASPSNGWRRCSRRPPQPLGHPPAVATEPRPRPPARRAGVPRGWRSRPDRRAPRSGRGVHDLT